MGTNTSDQSSEMVGLRDQLRSAQIDAGMSSGKFLPYSSLKDVISTQVVTDTLTRRRDISPGTASKIASFVCGKPEARKIFAILVWIGKTDLIETFYRYNFVDAILPLYIERDGNVETYTARSDYSEATHKVFSDERWHEESADFFCDAQWQFLGPIFSEQQFEYSFLKEHRLPFLQQSYGYRESHFRTVEKWCIHKAHFRKSSKLRVSVDINGHPIVAVRSLRNVNMNEADYKRAAETEADILKMIRRLQHPHLINAIAYYERDGRYALVSPWAGGGNLRDYWQRKPPRKLNEDFVGWAFGQLCGLASAVETLHSFSDGKCLHGNLKPENILCFEDGNGSIHPDKPILVISDVGRAKTNYLTTEQRDEAIELGMYEPPEARLPSMLQLQSKRYDIWSIACIYLEFLTWLLYGEDGRLRFEEDVRDSITQLGSFYRVLGSGAVEVKPVVYEWMDWIKQDPRCPQDTAVRMMLELISTRLLIIETNEPKSSTFKRASNQNQTDRQDDRYSEVPKLAQLKTYSGVDGTPRGGRQGRATSTEMLQSLRNIQMATTGSNSKIQWMCFQALSPGIPPIFQEELDEIGSVASAAPSLTAGSTMSSVISQILINSIRKNIIQFVFQDVQMKSLFEATPKAMDAKKFQRNFHRLFKGFIIELKTELKTLDLAEHGISDLEIRQVVRGLRSCSGWLARSVFEELCRTSIEAQVLDQEIDSQIHINRFLADDSELLLTKEELEVALPPPIDSYDLSDSPGDDSTSEEEDTYQPSYDGMKHLLSQSRSFENFKNRYRDFISPQSILKVSPDDDDDSTERAETFIERSATATWYHVTLRWLRKSARPGVKRGYKRLEWICDCGEEMYADFDASNADSLLNMQHFLDSQTKRSLETKPPQQSISSAKGAMDGSSRLQVPTTHHTVPMKPFPNEQSSKRQLDSNDQTTPQTSSAERTIKFLELCVNAGGFEPHLTEISTTCVDNDSQLFAKIRESYNEVRGFRNRLYLLKPIDVHFVKFSLEERHRAGISDKPKALPDMEQMSTKGYHYSPCPADFLPPMPTSTFLHYFHHKNPNAHPRLRWAHRIPQKLNTKIVDDADEFVVGWGIHIIEGVNRVDALLVTLFMLITSTIAAIGWTLVKDDIQGGFGIGSWVLTFQTVVLMLVLAKWNEL